MNKFRTPVNARLFRYPNGMVQARSYKNAFVIAENIDPDFDEIYQKEQDKKAQKLPDQERPISDRERSAEEKERKDRSNCNRAKNKIVQYSRSNVWDWFFTLTLDPAKTNVYDFELCSKKVRKWFNNIRKNYAPHMKYVVVPEQHKSGAWHFHALVADCGELKFTQAKNSKTGKPVYAYTKGSGEPCCPLFNIDSYKLGWSTASKIMCQHRVCNYLVKYITKTLIKASEGCQRYFVSQNLDLPEVFNFCTKTFGIEALAEICDALGIGDMNVQYTKRVTNDFQDMFSWELDIL